MLTAAAAVKLGLPERLEGYEQRRSLRLPEDHPVVKQVVKAKWRLTQRGFGRLSALVISGLSGGCRYRWSPHNCRPSPGALTKGHSPIDQHVAMGSPDQLLLKETDELLHSHGVERLPDGPGFVRLVTHGYAASLID
ncbi:hypothetical protein AB0B40_35735 [Streptomyces sp. NPDC042638]|uniref:hypothetical protein n=1 Tax=Streptomyces sp. NPDC042638 TaxID=3154333 RepID=UPI0033D5ACFF